MSQSDSASKPPSQPLPNDAGGTQLNSSNSGIALRSSFPLAELIVRRQNVLWGILIVIYAFAFTGKWRVGRDSSLYRGLAHSLATGRGYHFGDFGSRQVYPGLPVLLAGLEKIFSIAAWPGIIVMHLMALGCLILTYKLVRLHFPQWLAILVTFCVGMNSWFTELTNELLTDIPFLLGVLMALYGWERLRLAVADKSEAGRRKLVRPLIYLILGLALAAVMRPTFWVLAGAWVIVCVWGLIAGPARRLYAICLSILFIVWLAAALIDPRVRGFRPFQGGYEQDVIHSLRDLRANVVKNIPELTDREFNFSFFGQRWWPGSLRGHAIYVPGMTDLMSVTVILASLLLWRINPLWTLLVFMTVGVTLVMTVVPRYYTMVLPLLMLAWFLLTLKVADRVPARWFEVVVIIGIIAAAGLNFSRTIRVIAEQHLWTAEGEEEGPKWQYVMEMGAIVNKLVPPGEKVIAPAASIMAFVSDRDCVMQRDILPPHKTHWVYPAHLAALDIHYAVFPSRLYRKGDRTIRDLMDRGVIVPVERIAKMDDMALARIEIKIPPDGVDWMKQPTTMTPFNVKNTPGGTTRPSNKVLAAKKRHESAEKRSLAARKATALAKARAAKRKQSQIKAVAKKRKTKRHPPTTTNMPTTKPIISSPATHPVSLLSMPPIPWHERLAPAESSSQ